MLLKFTSNIISEYVLS